MAHSEGSRSYRGSKVEPCYVLYGVGDGDVRCGKVLVKFNTVELWSGNARLGLVMVGWSPVLQCKGGVGFGQAMCCLGKVAPR